jgi:hypothetical protein
MTSRMLLSALRSRTRYALATCLARPSSQLHVCNSSQAIHSSMHCSLSKTSQRQNAMMVLMGEPVSALGAPLNAASSTHLMTWRKGSLRHFVRSCWPTLYRKSGVFGPQIAKWKGSPSQAANWSSIISSDPNTPAVQATAFGLVGQAVVTTFPIRKYLGGELLGSKNGMKLIRN